MQDIIIVEVLQTLEDARHKEFGLVLRKTFVFTQVVPEVTTVHMIDHKVQIFPILKCTMHIDKEGVVELTQYFLLIHDRVDTSFANNAGFRHFFECV